MLQYFKINVKKNLCRHLKMLHKIKTNVTQAIYKCWDKILNETIY